MEGKAFRLVFECIIQILSKSLPSLVNPTLFIIAQTILLQRQQKMQAILKGISFRNPTVQNWGRRHFSATTNQKQISPYDLMKSRGLVQQVSNDILKEEEFCNEIATRLNKSTVSAYAGFDPTAPSLHLGNFITLLSLVRMSAIGLRPIFLVGGATGRIGDPSGKTTEREDQRKSEVANNRSKISYLIQDVLQSIQTYANQPGNLSILDHKYDTVMILLTSSPLFHSST